MTHFCLPSKNAQGFKIENAQNNKPKNIRTFCNLLRDLQKYALMQQLSEGKSQVILFILPRRKLRPRGTVSHGGF